MKYLLLGLILVILVIVLKNNEEKFEQTGIYKKTPLDKIH